MEVPTKPKSNTWQRAFSITILAVVIAAGGYALATDYVERQNRSFPSRLAKPAMPVAIPTPPPYETKIINLRAGQTYTLLFEWLKERRTLEGYFITEGGSNDIGFRVKAPSGNYLVNLGRVADRYNFRYVVSEEGPYSLIFDNTFSWLTPKTVILVYRTY